MRSAVLVRGHEVVAVIDATERAAVCRVKSACTPQELLTAVALVAGHQERECGTYAVLYGSTAGLGAVVAGNKYREAAFAWHDGIIDDATIWLPLELVNDMLHQVGGYVHVDVIMA